MRFTAQMRIALLPSAYHPSVGGVEELSRKLAGQLVLSGHTVEVWTSRRDGDNWAVLDDVDGVPVRRSTFPAPRGNVGVLARWPVSAAREFQMLRRAVQEFQPDVLHVQCFSTNGAYATALSQATGVPLVVTLQGETVMDDHDIFARSLFLRSALRLGLRRAAAVTACSRFAADDAVARFGLRKAKCSVIFNGVDLTEAAQQPIPLPYSRFVLGLGRVVEKKGFDLLVAAWAAMEHSDPEFGLVIAGDGADRPRLTRLAETLGVADRVHFTGVLGRAEVAWAMAHAEVFVMPSRVEPFGIVALEAWRAGTPIVVTSHGGAAEFVQDGHDGFVIDPYDTDALVAGMNALLGDISLRESFIAAGRSKAQQFSWLELTQRYVGVYARVGRQN